MNPSKVLLITLVGPYGEVDVAVRADLPAAELLPAFNELVGMRRGEGADRAEEPTPPGRSPAQPGGARNADPMSQTPQTPQQGPEQASPVAPSTTRAAGSGRHAAPGRGSWGSGARKDVSEGDQEPSSSSSPAYPAPRPVPGPATDREGRDAHESAAQGRRDIPLGGTLADAGIVDGTVLHLYRASRDQRQQEAAR